MTKLNAKQFEAFGPGKYADGDNLHLIVSPNGARRFVYSPRVAGKRPEYGFKATTLKEARLERDRLKVMLSQGIDPRTQKPLDAKPTAATFATVARQYIAERADSFQRHTIIEWERTVTKECADIANKPLDDITVADIKAVLLPVFAASPERAKRAKRKIAAIFDYAADHELCDRDRRSPAEGRTLLPATKAVAKHHTAMPYSEVSSFIAKLRAMPFTSARALELIILTATRSGETAAAQWSEIDIDNALWTIPPDRMKARKAHVIPLPPRAIQILLQMKEGNTTPFVFPGREGEEHITVEAILRLQTITMKLSTTTHGFRSSFRDWCGDSTDYPRELAEEALAHQVGNAVERAYRRGNALEKRRQMMNDWAAYCEPADNVVRLPAKKA